MIKQIEHQIDSSIILKLISVVFSDNTIILQSKVKSQLFDTLSTNMTESQIGGIILVEI